MTSEMLRLIRPRCDVVKEATTLRSDPRSAAPRRFSIETGVRACYSRPISISRSASIVADDTESIQRSIDRRGLLLSIVAIGAGTSCSEARASEVTEAEIEACTLKDTPIGIRFCDVAEGKGPDAERETRIKANYTGRFASDLKVFDSSYSRKQPLTFTVGTREVILGWDLGILGTEGMPPMKPGGKRRLVLPPKLAYGPDGTGDGRIPPDATLIFDVEYLGRR